MKKLLSTLCASLITFGSISSSLDAAGLGRASSLEMANENLRDLTGQWIRRVDFKGDMVFMLDQKGSDDKQIGLSDDAGNGVAALTTEPGTHVYPSMEPTGRFVVYAYGVSRKDTAIYVMDRKENVVEQWTSPRGQQVQPRFSRDGKFIAFSAPIMVGEEGRKESRNQIVILDLPKARAALKPELGTFESRTLHKYALDVDKLDPVYARIVPHKHKAYFPTMSSDNRFVIFHSSRDTKPVTRLIILHELATGIERELSDPNAKSMAPTLSHDDRLIAYGKQVRGRWHIFVTDWRTGETHQVTNSGPAEGVEPDFPLVGEFDPGWRPDGALVYSGDLKDGKDGLMKFHVITPEQIANKSFQSAPYVVTENKGFSAPIFGGDARVELGRLADLPEPARSSFGVARVGEQVYVVGGHQGREHKYPKESYLEDLWSFDLRTQAWKKAAPRPHAAHGFGIAAAGKYIYAFGGFSYSDENTPHVRSIDTIDRYDTEKDEWVTIGKMPRKRSSNAVVTVDGKIYLIGGWDGTPKKPGDEDGNFWREIDVFDPATEKMTETPHRVPDPLRRAFTAVVLGKEIVLLGGLAQASENNKVLDQVTAFNTETGAWRELAPLGKPSFAPGAGVIGDSLFVIGGMHGYPGMKSNYINHILRLDPTSGRWEHTGRYLAETKGFPMVVDLGDNKLGILGGHSYEQGDGPVRTFETLSYKSNVAPTVVPAPAPTSREQQARSAKAGYLNQMREAFETVGSPTGVIGAIINKPWADVPSMRTAIDAAMKEAADRFAPVGPNVPRPMEGLIQDLAPTLDAVASEAARQPEPVKYFQQRVTQLAAGIWTLRTMLPPEQIAELAEKINETLSAVQSKFQEATKP